MALWHWSLWVPEFQTLQDVKDLVLNSLEGVIQNATSTGGGGGSLTWHPWLCGASSPATPIPAPQDTETVEQLKMKGPLL